MNIITQTKTKPFDGQPKDNVLRVLENTRKDYQRILNGLLWQKNRLNTILEYTDELGESQTIVLDLQENVKYIQPRIYDHMMNSKSQ